MVEDPGRSLTVDETAAGWRLDTTAAAFTADWVLSRQRMPSGASSSAIAAAQAPATVASGR